jgi:hypothetical protein
VLSNEAKEQILKEVLNARGEFLMAQMRDMVEHGPPIPGRKLDGPQRLQGYFRDTLPQEMAMVLDEDYLKRVGTDYPEPVQFVYELPEIPDALFASEQEAMMAARQMGIMTPPMPKLSYWWTLFAVSPRNWSWTPFAHHQKDFVALLNQLGDRVEGKAATPRAY